MVLLKRLYGKLHLKINESKSAVADAFGRKFLGFSLWLARDGSVRRAVSLKALATFKQRIRQLTRRSGGRSMTELVEPLRRYVLGWKAYFGIAQTNKVWRSLDEWLRHRLRAIQLKQWRRGTTMYRQLRALGASEQVTRLVAANSRRWWRNSYLALNRVLTIAYFDSLGMPRLS
jgi:RNA-directed DNA polymerase